MKRFIVCLNGEDSNCNDFRIVDVVKVDGYHVGDRLLEGVIFNVRINKKNQFEVSIADHSKKYFEQFNQKKWFKAVRDYCEENDIFETNDSLDAVCYDDKIMPKNQKWRCNKIPNIIECKLD